MTEKFKILRCMYWIREDEEEDKDEFEWKNFEFWVYKINENVRREKSLVIFITSQTWAKCKESLGLLVLVKKAWFTLMRSALYWSSTLSMRFLRRKSFGFPTLWRTATSWRTDQESTQQTVCALFVHYTNYEVPTSTTHRLYFYA